MPQRRETPRDRLQRLVKAGELQKTKRKAEARRKNVRSDIPGTRRPPEPVLTAESAYEFVKLLNAGLPPLTAIAYFGPDHFAKLDEKGQRAWLAKWMRSPLVATAICTLNEGEWQNLSAESRLQIALDKAMAELAHFLYTHAYEDVSGSDRDKWTEARESIAAHLKANEGDEETPAMRALRDLLEGRIGAGPPQLQLEEVQPRKAKES